MKDQKVIMFGVDGLIPELVSKFSREGYLPNITKLMQEGSTTELLPYISTWGDVNWVSFLTGKAPGNAWKGQSIPKGNDSTFLGLADSEEKKCALVHFPQTVNTEDTEHFSFAPFYGGKEEPPFELATPRVFSTCLSKWPKKEVKESLGWPRTSSLAHHEKNNRSPIIYEKNQLSFYMQLKNNIDKEVFVYLINQDKIRLEFDHITSVEIIKNNWSDWVCLNLSNDVKGWVRFKLANYNQENQELDIIQSQLLQTDNISNQQELGDYLLEKNGPFIQSWTVKASTDELYHDSSFEEAKYQATWLADTAIELVENKGFDMFATVFRLNDETHHTSLGQYDPFSPFYKEESAPIYEENIRKSYIILDETIGNLLTNKTEDTTVILASDHGDVPNKYFCDVYLRLAEFGLSTIDEKGNPILEKSKAILKDERGGLEIFVNLEGREANGIVPKGEYEFVQDSIYKALSTWSYKEKQVSALTLKKQDASVIGYWGPDMGDVIFAYNLGFVWGTNKKDIVAEVSEPGANHGPQIPSSKTKHSSNLGIFIASGKTSNKGYKRNIEENGPYFMDDAGKTIASLLNIKDTSTLDGRFMTDLFNK